MIDKHKAKSIMLKKGYQFAFRTFFCNVDSSDFPDNPIEFLYDEKTYCDGNTLVNSKDKYKSKSMLIWDVFVPTEQESMLIASIECTLYDAIEATVRDFASFAMEGISELESATFAKEGMKN